MRIESTAVRVPSLSVTNDDVLAKLVELNPGLAPAEVRRYRRQLEYMLVRSGAHTRYMRDRNIGETALALIQEAVEEALKRASLKPHEIDLLIYCGVGRGFLEPAMAYFVCNALGVSCDCFDVLDACMGWVRALHIAHSLFSNGAYSRIMVVNGEFNAYEYGYPELLRIDSPNKLRYTFPAFTIGEAAAAAVLIPSDNKWNFHFRSDASKVSLCTLPLAGYDDYSDTQQVALNGVNRFMSFGLELSRAALRGIERFVRETYTDTSQFDLWFPHAASAELCRLGAERLNLGERLYSKVFPRYGNLVSASIPMAIVMAEEENRLVRGHRVVLCPASAGMALALIDFAY